MWPLDALIIQRRQLEFRTIDSHKISPEKLCGSRGFHAQIRVLLSSYSFVCLAHFSPKSFVTDLAEQLCGHNNHRRLTLTTVPIIFSCANHIPLCQPYSPSHRYMWRPGNLDSQARDEVSSEKNSR